MRIIEATVASILLSVTVCEGVSLWHWENNVKRTR